ncbi:MAG: hypothetical protein Q4A52_02725 [Bacillota bacterium]|nr:hypothetical protein [Bacillota bacterium]
MFFKRKMDRMTKAVQEQQAIDAEKYRAALPVEERSHQEEPLQLTKQDLTAVILSALITFGPILLILLAMIFFIARSL